MTSGPFLRSYDSGDLNTGLVWYSNCNFLPVLGFQILDDLKTRLNELDYSDHPKTESWSVFGFDFMPVPGTRIPDHSKTGRLVRFLNG
jgi:hypothetical protein